MTDTKLMDRTVEDFKQWALGYYGPWFAGCPSEIKNMFYRREKGGMEGSYVCPRIEASWQGWSACADQTINEKPYQRPKSAAECTNREVNVSPDRIDHPRMSRNAVASIVSVKDQAVCADSCAKRLR